MEHGDAVGVATFFAQLIGYGFYIFQKRIQPNAASWFMWLVGGPFEFATYNALEGNHWSTSALPPACAISVGCIFPVTAYLQVQAWRRKVIVKGDERWQLRCCCGSYNCRRIVGPIDSLPPHRFVEYPPSIQSYFARLYVRRHSERNAAGFGRNLDSPSRTGK